MIRHNLFYLSTLCAIAAPVAGQSGILPYLPEGTVFAMSAPDLKSSMAEFQKMPLAKMWAEEEVQTFFSGIQKMAGEQIDMLMAQAKQMHEAGELPIDPEQMRSLSMGGMAMALTKLELGMGEFGPEPKIGFVMHMDFGSSAAQWNTLLDIGMAMMEQQAGPMLNKSEKQVGDVKVITYAGPEESPMALNVAMVPNGMLVGTLMGDVETILTNMAAKTPVLGGKAEFAEAAKVVTTDGAEMVTYFQMSPALDFVTSALRMGAQMDPQMAVIDVDGIERALTASGLRGFGTMLSASSYVDGKCITKSFAANANPASTAASAPLDMGFLKWVPKQAVSVMASKFDMMAVHDALMRGLEAYSPEMAKQAMEQLAGVEQQLGFQLKQDLFGAFGDHMISWSMPMATLGAMPEVGMLIQVKNEESLMKVVRSVVAMSEGAITLEESDKRGFKSYQLRFEAPEGSDEMAMMMGGMNPFESFTPTFSFKNGYLVGAFSTADVKRVFTRLDREDDAKGDIRSNKEFELAMAGVPKSVTSFSFTDYKQQFESIYTIVSGALGVIPLGSEVPIDLAMLPEASSLTKHLYGGVTYAVSDANGTTVTSSSPIGPEMYLGLGVMLVGGIAGFAAVRGSAEMPMVEIK